MMRLVPILALLFCLSSCQAAPSHVGALKQPVLVPILYKGGEWYQSMEDYRVGEYVIPKGRVANGASVWRPVWWFMPPDGLHRAGAWWHDELYGLEGKMGFRDFTRKESDQEFYRLMVEAGISKARAGTAYRAVRIFGGPAWAHADGVILLPPQQAHERRFGFLRFRHLYAP